MNVPHNEMNNLSNNEIQNIHYKIEEKINTKKIIVEYSDLIKELEQHESIMKQCDLDYDIPSFLSDDELYDVTNDFNMDKLVDVIDNELEMDYDTRYAVYFQHYNDTYKKEDLKRISEYYEVCESRLNKDNMIDNIIFFEFNKDNKDIVLRRKQNWFYMHELKSDKYLKKFIRF